MVITPPDRRSFSERRMSLERRSGSERREGERRLVLEPVDRDRRVTDERRAKEERRSGHDRRSGPRVVQQETAGEHLRNALQLLGHVAEVGTLDEATQRVLDAALLRVRFALDRVERNELLEG